MEIHLLRKDVSVCVCAMAAVPIPKLSGRLPGVHYFIFVTLGWKALCMAARRHVFALQMKVPTCWLPDESFVASQVVSMHTCTCSGKTYQCVCAFAAVPIPKPSGGLPVVHYFIFVALGWKALCMAARRHVFALLRKDVSVFLSF